MPCKMVRCNHCQKEMRSDNLKRHEKKCRGQVINNSDHNSLQYIDLLPSAAAAGMSKPQDSQQYKDLVPNTASKSPVSNLKVSAIIGAIVNNGEPSTPVSSPEPLAIPSAPKRMSPAKSPLPSEKMKIISPLAPSKFDYPQMIGPSSDEENASLLEEEYFYNSPTSDMKRPTIVKDPHMDAEEKKLINRFSRLFQEMKQNGRDNCE